MTRYRFFIYRDSVYLGVADPPEERVIATDDPQLTARELCRGCIDRVDWDLAESVA